MAAGGQQDANDDKISQRQKEIIAATWNEIRGGAKDKVNSAENAKFLAEVQSKLKEQATSLAQRAHSRELAGANQEFQTFVKDMEEAATQMGPGFGQAQGTIVEGRARVRSRKPYNICCGLRRRSAISKLAFGNQGGEAAAEAAQRRARFRHLCSDLELDTEKNPA